MVHPGAGLTRQAAAGTLLCGGGGGMSTVLGVSRCPVGSISEPQLALFENLLLVGAVAGSLLGGWLVDALGRRSALRLAGAPALAGWLMVLVGPGSRAGQIGRVLTGLAAGPYTSPLCGST